MRETFSIRTSKIRELTNQTEKINGLNRFFLQFYTAKESLFLISLLDKSKTSTERVELFAYENNWNKYDTSSLSP